jgi:hypothetical protein
VDRVIGEIARAVCVRLQRVANGGCWGGECVDGINNLGSDSQNLAKPIMSVPLIELDLRMPMVGLNFKRVLFLDIDGVLHPDGPGDYDDFSCLPSFCAVLRAADPAGAVPIVVTSAWRHTQRLDDIKINFPSDLRLQIVGVTPDWSQASTAWMACGASHDVVPYSRHRRQGEIVAWISRNAPGSAWLAVDDRAMGFVEQCPHLFLVHGSIKDGGGPGITPSVAIDLKRRLDEFLVSGAA